VCLRVLRNRSYDVVVVGAGPAGSAAARRCAEHGLSVALIEEHAQIGSPVQCAGLLSMNAFQECDVSDDSLLHTVRGATLVTGDGCRLSFAADEPKAVVVDRACLDREMASKAAHAGVDLLLKTSVTGMSGQELFTTGVDGKGSLHARMVIAADGPRSLFTRIHGMERFPVVLSGIQAEIPLETDPDRVNLYPEASPEFFGWCIPSGPGRARIGLCGTKQVPERFAQFSRQFRTESQSLHQVTGTIPLGILPQTFGPRTLFVGDAAGFAKPTSGGGVYTGVRSGHHAADIAALCCGCNDFSSNALSAYETRWKNDFGKELHFGMKIFSVRQKMGPEELRSFCRLLSKHEIIEMIVAHADMDRPQEIAGMILKKPGFLFGMFRVIGPEILTLFSS